MTVLKPYILLVARILLAALFLIAAAGKLADFQAFVGYLASGGVPTLLAWPVVLLELLGGFAILIGFQTRAVALALAGFTLLTGLLYHFQPADQMQMTVFFKNLAIAGGFLLLSVEGAGTLSADARLSAKPGAN